jgi:hypothetical protein
MIKLKNILNEELKKRDMDKVGKKINKATALINKANDILHSAWNDVRRLEDKAGDDYNDPKSVERAIYNLKGSISDGMIHMLKDPLKKSGDILTQIIDIGRRL